MSDVTVTMHSTGENWQVTLKPEGTSIGRSSTCDIVIDSKEVSRHHARLEQVDHGTQILDLGSSNGLICQQVQIAQMLLADGDQVWIAGAVSLIFKVTQLAPAVAAAGPPAFE